MSKPAKPRPRAQRQKPMSTIGAGAEEWPADRLVTPFDLAPARQAEAITREQSARDRAARFAIAWLVVVLIGLALLFAFK